MCYALLLSLDTRFRMKYLQNIFTDELAIASDIYKHFLESNLSSSKLFQFPLLGRLPEYFAQNVAWSCRSFIWRPQSSGTAEWLAMPKRQVASLFAWALFISAVVPVFPMAAAAGCGSLWSFWDDRALCLLGGTQVTLSCFQWSQTASGSLASAK